VFISLTPDVKPADREFTTGKQILLTRDNDKLDTMLTKFFEECATRLVSSRLHVVA
jgi:hypothetical protein